MVDATAEATPEQADTLLAFATGLDFTLDPFQIRACNALAAGSGVLVCAPTGSGKTVVGEFAVHLALESGGKCFYTTPIKALSNQKYSDLCDRHGTDAVGLLTGDQSVNSHAPILVMTTEVLRNMLYADSPALRGLSHVVMDEVHYLADRSRGAVWEEVILNLPQEVRVASLSATVSNAEEFGAWMQTVRGDTTIVVDEHRPVPLYQHVMVGPRIFGMFADTPGRSGRGAVVAQDLQHYVKKKLADESWSEFERGGRGGGRGGGSHGGYHGGGGSFRPLPRPQVIANLDDAGLLPAITFIFSRAGCDGALNQCLRSGLRLTTPAQVEEIREVIHRHTADLPKADRPVLGYDSWRESLERGFAAHHAGMLPLFRHTVEELFLKGLVRAVFATETLALGINMPARTVVLERLVKYNGETHADLTPGEYTQLTGRAGRRGIDVEGHAVVLWQPAMDITAVAGLASTRTYPLRSSFQPAYNMSINLVRRLGSDAARTLIERSFAQFQSDRSVVGLAQKIDRNTEALEGYREHLDCHLGDFVEYAELRDRIKTRERALERQTREERRAETVQALSRLRHGDVIAVTSGRRSGLAVVLEPDLDRSDPRPLVLNEDRWAGQVAADDFRGSVKVLGSIRLPRRLDHRSPHTRRELAETLRSSGLKPPRKAPHKTKSPARKDSELAGLRRELTAHPCHSCPELHDHSRWGERYFRLYRETDNLRQKRSATSHSLVRGFDRILALLTELEYLEVVEGTETVTDAGLMLGGLYSESALVVAESLRLGAFEGLPPAELAAVVSALVYESRRATSAPSVADTDGIRRGLGEINRLWLQVRSAETRHRLSHTREPDAGFASAIYRWATDEPLVDVLYAAGDEGKALSAGDFVRWCRQVIDLLDQIHTISADKTLKRNASAAIAAIRRGVVAIDAV
ncbi:DEAD/DEAH box helicase [Tomitella biformata]|uniref:DEAD/DEAH box helicase n=1 Tax=Tomitella biformata TaxID=630403 RepID=UPI0004655C31|nr:DEAD/DEAH box helicase [Tomitella biformata]